LSLNRWQVDSSGKHGPDKVRKFLGILGKLSGRFCEWILGFCEDEFLGFDPDIFTWDFGDGFLDMGRKLELGPEPISTYY
jgi:hypothetical protein